jgi:uncharacterized protein
VDIQRDLFGLLIGFVIATVTAPVGVSGAVFLLPIQLTVLGVPSPQITPTNLLYNVIGGPGALLRYVRQQQLHWRLARQITVGTAPGVVVGAVLRVFVVTDPTAFRLLAAAVLLPTGLLILNRRRPLRARPVRSAALTTLAFVIGVVGGLYGIGGGSLIGPILVSSGLAVSVVAPAALASTFVTSVIGVLAYVVLALHEPGTISPDWSLGIACGIGGLLGGYLGAHFQPLIPERRLRDLLGYLAVALAAAYVLQALT